MRGQKSDRFLSEREVGDNNSRRWLKFVTLRDKPFVLTKRVLIWTTLASLCAVVAIGSFGVRKSLTLLEKSIKSDLLAMGRILVASHGQAMRGMAEDRDFVAINELVTSTVQQNADIVYGIYMDSSRLPVVMANSDHPDDRAATQSALNDSTSLWAASVSEPDYVALSTEGSEVFEFAAAVAGSDHRHGTLRYGLTASALETTVARARHSARINLLFLMTVLTCIAALAVYYGSRSAYAQADGVIKSPDELARSATITSKGDYSVPVESSSGDEVKNPADTLTETSQQRTQEMQSQVEEPGKIQDEIASMEKRLSDKTHQAGVAAIATGVLHNVGNVLTSVNTSASVMLDILQRSRLDSFAKANSMFREHKDDLEHFIVHDPRGKKLIQYYAKLERHFRTDHAHLLQNAERLKEKVSTINDVITAQQGYARSDYFSEKLSLIEIVEDTLRLQAGSNARHDIHLEKKFSEVPKVLVQRNKVIHILLNLYKNAKEAMDKTEPELRNLTIVVEDDEAAAYIKVIDRGDGIERENLDKVFTHGFTTKKDGHGFGLHSCGNYMTDMGGSMWVESDGVDKGACFVLRFPLQRND